jgi:hypothetical protein
MGDCWTDKDYNEVLSFVENYLWIFVQENAAIHKPEPLSSRNFYTRHIENEKLDGRKKGAISKCYNLRFDNGL